MVTSTNMSLEVLPTIRKKPMLEWRMASETARLAALVASLPWTSTPMPISVIQRTRAIGVPAVAQVGSCPNNLPQQSVIYLHPQSPAIYFIAAEPCIAVAGRNGACTGVDQIVTSDSRAVALRQPF